MHSRKPRKRPKKPVIVHERTIGPLTAHATDDDGIYSVQLIEETGLVFQTRVCFHIAKAIKESSEMLRDELARRRIDTAEL